MFKRHMSDDEVLYMFKMNEILGNPSVSGVTRDITRLMPFLFIGGQHNAESLNTLRTNKITYVLNCGGTAKQRGSPYQGLGIEYHQFIASDDDNYNISQHFSEAFNFIEKAKKKGAKILVHCAMGINRSGAVCAAYLMRERRTTLLETMKVLKTNRLVTLTNIGFRFQLIQFARSMGLLDSLKHIKKEVEQIYAKENLLGDRKPEKHFGSIKVNAYPVVTSDRNLKKSWEIPENVPKYRYTEPTLRSIKPVEPLNPIERSFQPVNFTRTVPLYEDRLPRPRIVPSVYKPVEYEDFVPIGVKGHSEYKPVKYEDFASVGGKGPIIDPELLEAGSPYQSMRQEPNTFLSTPSADSFRYGRSVNVGRRHSLAPSMTHYDNGRYVDNIRRNLYF